MSGRWRVRRLPVCASTERELERWLQSREPPLSEAVDGADWRRLVVARRQRHGRGQQGRIWLSPPGGLWLSAAFPWPADPAGTAPLALALALGLARELQPLGPPGAGLPLAIKWPNDLLLGGRKLAGLLPRLRLRGGRVRWAQLGLGLNGINRVPAGAVALGESLHRAAGRPPRRFDPRATPRALEPLARRAIERALALAREPARVHREAEQLLWRPPQGLHRGGVCWRILGLEPDGALRVQDPDGRAAVWRRDF